MSKPVVTQRKEPRDFGFDVELDQFGARSGIVGDRIAVVPLAAKIDEFVDDTPVGQATHTAMLDFEMRRGYLPAVVFAADEVIRGNAHVVEEDRILYAGAASAFASRRKQIHRRHGDPRQI